MNLFRGTSCERCLLLPRNQRYSLPFKKESLREDVDCVFDGIDLSVIRRNGATDDDSAMFLDGG